MWLGAALLAVLVVARARRRGAEAELAALRRSEPLVRLEHASFLLALSAGLVLATRLGWGVGYPRGFGLKLGLVAFLLVPLEAMHAWIRYGWVTPGLRETAAPPFSPRLARGLGMLEMLRSLAAPLLLLSLPLLVWLSVAG